MVYSICLQLSDRTVSILVLMDVAFEYLLRATILPVSFRVSILVLMDVAFE